METVKKLLSKQNIFRIIAIIGIFLVLYLAVENGILTRQYSYLLVPVGINVILAVSLNLTTGYLGELTLGHAGFMSVGAYAGGLFSIYANLPYFPGFILALLVGGIVAAFFGLLIGIPVLRLRGDYLAIVTLAFGEIIRSVITNLPITGGASGLNNIPMYTTYISVYVVVIFTILIVMNLVNSRHGRAICSIREDYIASESVGISLTKYKILAFVSAAFFAGMAGVLYSHNLGFVQAKAFDYNKSIEILVIVVLGGMGSLKGSVISAIIITLLPEMLRGMDNYRMLVYAVVLIAMMLFNASKLKEWLKVWMHHHMPKKQVEGGEQ